MKGSPVALALTSTLLLFEAAAAAQEDVPAALRPCALCHRSVVETYLDHGMLRSVAPPGRPEPGAVTHPSGRRYQLSVSAGGAWLDTSFPDGGRRRQRVVGRIGAGIFDTSWAAMEVDVLTGAETGRLFFAPVETIAGHGLELSPFDLGPSSPGVDMALNEGCLTCHTTGRLQELPGAAGAARGRNLLPDNALGADAFEHLAGIVCEDCHGDARRHLELMPGSGEIGLRRLGEEPAAAQRDVCARCHLQGDARIDLARGTPRPELPLLGQVPVVVAERRGDDFRFVSQLERLALSACYQATPEMTCTTCHAAHAGVRTQGIASFDATCQSCHDCSRPPDLKVAAVTGEPRRTQDACVDCHVRRSQPFDLPHVKSADHFVRRRIPPPRDDIPHRQFADPTGELDLFDDGRLAATLKTPGGQRWRSGVLAMALMTMGRFADAAPLFDQFPPPGSPGATIPAAPPKLLPLNAEPSFHQLRAMALMASRRVPEALAAYSDALKLDPVSPGALMGRARLSWMSGDVRGALVDTQTVIESYPRAEHPWNLRAEMAERLQQPRLVTAAFLASARAWPSNPVVWYRLGLLLEQQGDANASQDAFERVQALRPGLLAERGATQ